MQIIATYILVLSRTDSVLSPVAMSGSGGVDFCGGGGGCCRVAVFLVGTTFLAGAAFFLPFAAFFIFTMCGDPLVLEEVTLKNDKMNC